MSKILIKGAENCQHQMVLAKKKRIQHTFIRCVKCGQEEVHESEV